MSGSFWRFGNVYNDVSSINNLLENGFIEKDSKIGTTQRRADKYKQRNNSLNASSDDEEDDLNSGYSSERNDDTIDDNDEFEETSLMPNLEILDDLLDDNDLLEELAGSNMKLIEYLRNRQVLAKLIEYIVTEDDEIDETESNGKKNLNNEKGYLSDSDSEDTSQFDPTETTSEIHKRRAQACVEILSADAWSLTDSFMDNSDLLGNLWDILERESPLSMTLSTYFMKINEHLLNMKIDEMLNFLLHQNKLVDRFMRHIDNPPLMDFLLKVISTDKPDNPTGIIDLLKSQNLISKLIDFLDPEISSSIQSAAGDFIKAFVTISANSNADNSTIGPNELTRELVSEEMMEKLSNLMLNGGTSLSNGVGIIIEIIRKNNSDYDFVPVLFITIESHPPTSRDPVYLGHLIKVFSKKIQQFAKLLKITNLPNLETPFGSIEPLGFERFKICELIAELLHCSNMGLLNDENGESIVRERDLERERVIQLEHRELIQDEQDDNDDDNKTSDEMKRLSISSSKDNKKHHEQINDNESEISETETDKEFDEDKTAKILESEPDSDEVDATLASGYDKEEQILRKQALVGDQLKIALADNSIIMIILKMFFHFPWNNFLHNVVFDIVQQILNGSMEIGFNKYLAIELFGSGEITNLIVEGQEKCESYEKESGLRLGYMGHLTLIAEEVVKFTALYPPSTIHQIVVDAVSTNEWLVYVTETLVETREKYNALLGGGVDGGAQEEDEEDDVADDNDDNDKENQAEEHSQKLVLDPSIDHDIVGSNFDDDEKINDDKFSRYMSQQLANDLPDKFGSSDEDEDEDDLVGWNNRHYDIHSYHTEADDEDDYVDPNDDGQSYVKKDHPLYSQMLSTSQETPSFIDDDEDSSSSSSDNDDDDEKDEGNGLTRSKSKDEGDWDDEDEQQRFQVLSNYIKNHS